MFLNLAFALLQTVPATQPKTPSGWVATHPALAAKAPGAPGYGLEATTPIGKILLTNLCFDPATRRPMARAYLIQGPAGWGPYRSGFEGHMGHFHPSTSAGTFHAVWYQDHFEAQGTPKDCPAARSGLDVTNPLFVIDRVDGQTFGWDPNALTFHITNSPTIRVEAIKLPVFFGPSYTTRTVTNERIATPPDPADAKLIPLNPQVEVLKALLADPKTWADLLILRSQQPAFAPLALDLAGHRVWTVLAQGPRSLEFWKEDPRTGAFESGLLDMWPEPANGFRVGRVLRIADHWYRFQNITQDPATGQLTSLGLRPFEVDIPVLLEGRTLAKALGPQPDSSHQEALEQVANDALLEWKTLTLPGELAALDLKGVGSFVVRLEKGVLALDLEVKGIRSRLDAAARAEAERKAQAELAVKGGQPASHAQAPPATESERLADLLEQRKAILMAILGSAKQALANLRR